MAIWEEMGVEGVMKNVLLEVVFRKMDRKSWIFKIKDGGANGRNCNSVRYGIIYLIGISICMRWIGFFTKWIYEAHFFTWYQTDESNSMGRKEVQQEKACQQKRYKVLLFHLKGKTKHFGGTECNFGYRLEIWDMRYETWDMRFEIWDMRIKKCGSMQ